MLCEVQVWIGKRMYVERRRRVNKSEDVVACDTVMAVVVSQGCGDAGETRE